MYELGWIRQSLGPDWKAFENILKAALDSPYALLSDIDSYLLNKPGKQLRPVLALCAARISGTPCPLTHAVAAVAEMIHTASLLHDDVADNADTRRGTLSVQKQYGPRASILMGDYWFARAFRTLLQYEGTHLFPLYADAIQALSEGEMLQLEKSRTLDLSFKDYYTICKNKTASLFLTAMVSGALSVPGSEISSAFRPVFEKAAYHMGMAFQIQDDIMDYQPAANVGKPYYKDITESKITLPLLGALSNGGDGQYRPRVVAWIRRLEQGDRSALDQIVGFVDKYQGLEFATGVLRHHQLLAQERLGRLPGSPWQEALLKIAGM
ncbi:MAG: polyprenyl synthetase family protein [Bacteroidales bacterium]|jgi:octaprenyl-diphosphate synthase